MDTTLPMYKLSKDALSKSAYYCAAETDIQPLLRFGDIISDFIYLFLLFLDTHL